MRVCQNWFSKFRAGNTSCEDNERSGRPSVVDDDQIKTLIEKIHGIRHGKSQK